MEHERPPAYSGEDTDSLPVAVPGARLIFAYCTEILSSFTSRANLSESSRTIWLYCSAVPPAGACACRRKLLRTLASASAAFTTVFSRLMMSGEVPAGTNTPVH